MGRVVCERWVRVLCVVRWCVLLPVFEVFVLVLVAVFDFLRHGWVRGGVVGVGVGVERMIGGVIE